MAGPHRWVAQTPSSWVAGSFDTGLLPASNEVVIFDELGQGDVIGGLNQTAVDLDLLRIERGYRGRIGRHGDPLIISADIVTHRGTGTLHYTDGSGITDLMIIDSPNNAEAAFLSGTIDRLRIIQGRVELMSGISAVSSLEISRADDAIVPPYVTINEGVTAGFVTGWFRMDDGRLEGIMPLDSAVPTTASAILFGGYWKVTKSEATVNIRAIIGTGGVLDVVIPDATAGTVRQWNGQFDVMGGSWDFRGTSLLDIGDVHVWQNGEVLYNDDASTFIITEVRMKP